MSWNVQRADGSAGLVEPWPQQTEIYNMLSTGDAQHVRYVFVSGHRQSGKTTAVACWIADRIKQQKRDMPLTTLVVVHVDIRYVDVLHNFVEMLQRALRPAGPDDVEIEPGDCRIVAWRDGQVGSRDIVYRLNPPCIDMSFDPTRQLPMTIIETTRPLMSINTAWWTDPGCVAAATPQNETLTGDETRFRDQMLKYYGVEIDDAHLRFRRQMILQVFCGDEDVFNRMYPVFRR